MEGDCWTGQSPQWTVVPMKKELLWWVVTNVSVQHTSSIFRFEVQLLFLWGKDILPKRRKLPTTLLSVSVEYSNLIVVHETCCL
jgi:hypothetical protein